MFIYNLALIFVAAKTDIDDVNSKDDDNFYLKKNSNFTGICFTII